MIAARRGGGRRGHGLDGEEALPDFDVSWVLVAVTVAVVAEAGAVKRPLLSMVPVLADQVTEEL